MENNQFTLTKNEQEIMNLLWQEGRSLSSSGIIELSPNRSWKNSSIHVLLSQMLDKGVIVVDGFVKTGKNYGRTFCATTTLEKYQVMQFIQSPPYVQSKSTAIINFISCLLANYDIDDEILDELELILQNRRNK